MDESQRLELVYADTEVVNRAFGQTFRQIQLKN